MRLVAAPLIEMSLTTLNDTQNFIQRYIRVPIEDVWGVNAFFMA